MNGTELPALDCHAHVAPDVTERQVRALGNSIVFAVTRSLKEAEAVAERDDDALVWGCGVHPGVREARNAFETERFKGLLSSFGFIGEVGLDRRAGDLPRQQEILRSILKCAGGEPVLISIHSTGCISEVLEVLDGERAPGAILHWFGGDRAAVQRAVSLGCYFSVNATMSDETLRNIPIDRMLPETDFPATRRRGGGEAPGAVAGLESRTGTILGITPEELRLRWYLNLRTIADRSGAIDRLPEHLVDILVPL
jgi:TatD DNase family protein